MNIFQTQNFNLRQVTIQDLNDYVSFWSDDSVMHFIGDGTLGGGNDVVKNVLEKYILAYASHPHLGFWAVVDLKTGKVIGEAGIAPNEETKEIEAGYILHRDYWGKGYGTEILTGLIHYGFHTLNLEQIIAVAHPDNKASIQIMCKCGMKFEKMAWYHNRYSVKYIIHGNP